MSDDVPLQSGGVEQPRNITPPATTLPIHAHKNAILDAVQKHQVVIVAGATGCGKSTQLPQFCLEAMAGLEGTIAVTQPRRIAATSLARRVAAETYSLLGAKVGYRVRFDECMGADTRVVFLTDGMLLAETGEDPLLRRYRYVIIDEAHERNLNIDFLLGYFRAILPRRPDLRLIISSATIDTEKFSTAFGRAPVIDVEGRLFPIEVWYRPLDEEAVEAGEISYIDAAAAAVEEIAVAGDTGDVLVFMPTERDIHETLAALRERRVTDGLCLPLFARLTKAEQERIFHSSSRRKIIVATNIAETSLTVPGIRFVIDTGLARVNRYVPRSRTTRLPVEPISQSSADQRKGRCGRVGEGLCIRLYAPEDLAGRPQFGQPEIRRANLDAVILRMAEARLGRVEDFPFIDPPDSAAVRDGYARLIELGALDEGGELTVVGRSMAALPLDPCISRMVLQARAEGCLKEVMIIAAGLSVSDPRERPADQKEKADAMQRPFVDQGSDFMTLLRLWLTYQAEWERLRTQNALRRFCRAHFLSYPRMREWHDIHEQINDSLHLRKGRTKASDTARPLGDAIHRSILCGLVANVAMKRPEGEGYAAARNRVVHIFPGSALSKKKTPWIVCAEIVETSRVFARTVGPIDPAWIEELAPALCRSTCAEPFFDQHAGTVRAHQNVTFFGLPIVRNRPVVFSRFEPRLAAQIFIREGLVNEQLQTSHPFFNHNRRLRAAARKAESKLRIVGLAAGDDAVQAWYAGRIPGIASVHDLNRAVRERGGDRFLYMQESEAYAAPQRVDADAFPDFLSIGGRRYPLSYIFLPGAEDDGVTMTIPQADLVGVPAALFEYLVPGLLPHKIAELMQALPKAVRKDLAPMAERTAALCAAVKLQARPLAAALAEAIVVLFGITVDPGMISDAGLPAYLSMRLVIVDAAGTLVRICRCRASAPPPMPADDTMPWPAHVRAIVKRHERHDESTWIFGDIPDIIALTPPAEGFALQGYPAIVPNKRSTVDFLLYASEATAQTVHRNGIRRLCQCVLAEDFSWLERDLRIPREMKLACKPLGGDTVVSTALCGAIQRFALYHDGEVPRTKCGFDRYVARVKEMLRTAAAEAPAILGQVVRLEAETRLFLDAQARKAPARLRAELQPEMKRDLDEYGRMIIADDCLYERFRQLPRLLRAMRCRIERAFGETAKYRERMLLLNGFADQSRELWKNRDRYSEKHSRGVEELISMVDEFAISLFAQQEVKALFPVSEKRLRERLNALLL
jgi:ATP-dependent helicase HrpA